MSRAALSRKREATIFISNIAIRRRGGLRRDAVDVHIRSEFEARREAGSWGDLGEPAVGLLRFVPPRPAVDNEVVIGAVEQAVEALQGVLEGGREEGNGPIRRIRRTSPLLQSHSAS